MGRYIDWSDVANRYPEVGANQRRDATQMDSSYIYFAEANLDGRLSQGFTTPFSNNNVTAKDLAIDITYAMIYRFKDVKKTQTVEDYIKSRVEGLLSGKMSMITTSGDQLVTTGDVVYSTTQNYQPVFGISPALAWQVDSAAFIDEEAGRGRYY